MAHICANDTKYGLIIRNYLSISRHGMSLKPSHVPRKDNSVLSPTRLGCADCPSPRDVAFLYSNPAMSLLPQPPKQSLQLSSQTMLVFQGKAKYPSNISEHRIPSCCGSIGQLSLHFPNPSLDLDSDSNEFYHGVLGPLITKN